MCKNLEDSETTRDMTLLVTWICWPMESLSKPHGKRGYLIGEHTQSQSPPVTKSNFLRIRCAFDLSEAIFWSALEYRLDSAHHLGTAFSKAKNGFRGVQALKRAESRRIEPLLLRSLEGQRAISTWNTSISAAYRERVCVTCIQAACCLWGVSFSQSKRWKLGT